MSACPPLERLRGLADDSPDDPSFLAIEAHVEACADCQGALQRLVAESSASDDHRSGRPAHEARPPAIPGFVIERELGRGGMGVVYQAWQPQLARRVAIKVVSAGAAAGPGERRRWLREAQAIGQIRHRNVVRLYRVGEQDGCLYLVLDLIPGGSLADRERGPLPARAAAGLLATVARTMDQVHRDGLLHLDIKPSNILLDGPPEAPWDRVTPMIADFGIARPGDDPGGTASGPIAVPGTPSFMAPEQIAGDRTAIGPRSDVYALGATLYSLLTGRPPFQAASVIETLDLVRTREPAPPRTLVPDLPRDLETIALTCLRKDPRRRYASAGALADDLRRWLDGFPIRARPVSTLERAGRWCRRRPAIAAMLAAMAITVVSSLVGLLTLWRHSEAQRARAEEALARAVASDRATSSAVRDLVGLLATTVDAPQMLASERFEETSRAVRELTAKLRRNRGFAASNLVAICDLERQLAEDFRRRGKQAESRALLADSLDLLEGRRRAGEEPGVDEAYTAALIEMSQVAQDQGRIDEVLELLRRAEGVLTGLAGEPRNLDAIVSIDVSLRRIAGMFAGINREEVRRDLLEAHIRMLDRMGARPGSDPAIPLLAAMARWQVAPDAEARRNVVAAVRRYPTYARNSEVFRMSLSRWIALDVRPYASGPESDGAPGANVAPDVHARTIIQALESRGRELGVLATSLPAAAVEVAGLAATRGGELRKAGRLEDARWTAASLAALAETLLRRDPDEASYHLVRCTAFEQQAKNAWKAGDAAAIRTALTLALSEAREALRLDPGDGPTRLRVAGVQDKLVDLASGRASPR